MDSKALATEVVKRLVREGYIAYFAGGWVRDFLMGHPSSDIDIATNAPPEKILDLFPRTILVGLSFGVIIVIVEGHQFEVSTFRRDLGYADGRRPDQIELATPLEDAQRRDFTINGMFYDPLEDIVHDYVHGAEDIELGIIRAIGNPYERFMEDRLRMIRAIRFASRFGFTIDAETQEAIISNADSLFPAVAIERVWQELNKMCSYGHFDHALVDMHRLGLLHVIFPKLEGLHLNDLRHRIACFSHFPANTPTILYIAQLFPSICLEDLLDIGKTLKVPNRDLKLLELFHKAQQMNLLTPDRFEWARFYADDNSMIVLDILAAAYPIELQKTFLLSHQQRMTDLLPHIERIQKKQPLVTAAYLQQHGISPGKMLGELLRESDRLSVNMNLVEPNDVLKILKTMPYWPTQ